MKTVLEPCPFCGSTDLRIDGRSFYNELVKEHGTASLKVHCFSCDLDLWEHSFDVKDYDRRVEMLIKKWNTRKG